MTSPAALEMPKDDIEFCWVHDGERRTGRLLSVGYLGQLGIIVTVRITFPDEPDRPDYKLTLPGRIVPSGARLSPGTELPERIAMADAATAALTFDIVTAYAFHGLEFDAWMDDTDRDGMKLLVNVARHMSPGSARDVAVALIRDGFAGTSRELIGAATTATAA